jgi:Cft2 family RNA processing exonuclease
VTLVPVAHMPGAVMFLFRTNKGKTILYTGDFVVDPENLKDIKELHCDGKPIKIDLLYYDATFCSGSMTQYTLPKRGDCIEQLTRTIETWLAQDDKNVAVIETNYRHGYEDLLIGISQKTGLKVQISDDNNMVLKAYR